MLPKQDICYIVYLLMVWYLPVVGANIAASATKDNPSCNGTWGSYIYHFIAPTLQLVTSSKISVLEKSVHWLLWLLFDFFVIGKRFINFWFIMSINLLKWIFYIIGITKIWSLWSFWCNFKSTTEQCQQYYTAQLSPQCN